MRLLLRAGIRPAAVGVSIWGRAVTGNGSHTQVSNAAEAQVADSVACGSRPGPLHPEKLTFLSAVFLF